MASDIYLSLKIFSLMIIRNVTPKLFLTVWLSIVFLAINAQTKSPEQQITETVRALPESLRDGAKIIGYNGAGERVILREGENDMICWGDDPNSMDARGAFFVVCFPKSLEPYMNRIRELASNGESMFDIIADEIESGKITMPKLAIRYTLRGHSAEGALPLSVIHVPYATSESTGLSTEINNFRPWLMWASTPHAHIMVPGH